jgi:hypothetical protein
METQYFKAERKLYFKNEQKSWLLQCLFFVVLYLASLFLFEIKNYILIVIVFSLVKLRETFFKYRVKEIQINHQDKQLCIVLKSIIEGEEVKRYHLADVTSTLVQRSGPMKHLFDLFYLQIAINPSDKYLITGRYGFSLETLTAVDEALRSKPGNMATTGVAEAI